MSIRKRTWTTAKGEEKSAWIVDYVDQAGDRHRKAFAKKKDADAWAADTAVSVRAGTHTPDRKSITVAEAADEWLQHLEREGLERSSIDRSRGHVVYHIKPELGSVKLSQLTTPRAEAFKDHLLDKCSDESRDKPLSRTTAKMILHSLKAIVSDAQRRGNVAQNVVRDVTIRDRKRDDEKPQTGRDIPTREEIQAILECATGRWRPLLITAVFTGMRVSELRGLAWDDVDLDAGSIAVRQRADLYNNIGSPKSKESRRTIPLPPLALNTLKEWRLACPKSELGLVFPNGAGNIESSANIRHRGLGPIQLKAGVSVPSTEKDEEGQPIMRPKYGMHALRHFYASWLIDRGFQAKRVQALMGHSSIKLTFDTYGHLFPNDDREQEMLASGELSVIGNSK